jgi:hypothetical protein
MVMTFQVTIDCAQPHVLADWWADALGWAVEPSDEAFIRSMVQAGHAQESDTTTHRGTLVWAEGAALVPPEGMPRVLFVRVPEPKRGKNRLHLDLRAGEADRPAQLERLLAAGATEIGRGSQGPHTWVVLTDPEGNEFCLA